MISRRLFSTFLVLIMALLWQLSSPRDCHAYAFAYIPNNGDNNVSILKVRDNSLQGTINVGAEPYGVAVSKEYVYVANTPDGTVSIISMSTNTKIDDPINTGNSPRGMAASSDSSYLYVANHSDDTLSVIDVLDNSRTVLDGLGAGPLGVALSPDEGYIYVTNNLDDSLSVIDAYSLDLFVTLTDHYYIYYYNDPDEDVAFDKPYGVAVSPDGYHIFVVNNGNNTLSILSANEIYEEGDNFDWDDYDSDDDDDGPYTLYTPIEVGSDPRCVAVTPDGYYAYVTNYGDDTVSVIEIDEYFYDPDGYESETIHVGNGPYGISVTPSSTFVYVVNQLDGTVSVIDIDYDSDSFNTVIDTVDVGNSPVGFGDFLGGKPPRAPSNLKATRKSTYTINLTWNDNSEDELGFKLFRKHYVSGQYSEIATLAEGTTSYTDEGLEGTSNYYYYVVAYNHAGDSDYSNISYATTSDDSGCFIATASYGSPMESHVKTLRDFRDHFLATSSMGKNFLYLYYKYSPPIAHYIENHEILRFIIRWSLLPVVGISRLFLSIGPVWTLTILVISVFLAIGVVIGFKRWALSRTEKCILFC